MSGAGFHDDRRPRGRARAARRAPGSGSGGAAGTVPRRARVRRSRTRDRLATRGGRRQALQMADPLGHLARRGGPGRYRLTVDSAGRGYPLANADGLTLERGVVGDSIGARLGLLWAPPREVLSPGRRVRFAVATVRDGARRLEEALDVRTDPQGNFLHLGLRGPSPARVTDVVNAVAQRYVQVAADLKREKLTELTKILDQQLESARQNLSGAEAALEGFGVRTITLPSDRAAPGALGADPDPAIRSFFDVQLERDQARRDREALEQVVAQARDSGVSATALEAIGAVQRNADLSQALKELVAKQAELRALKYRYADAYPPVQRLTAEIATLQRETIP